MKQSYSFATAAHSYFRILNKEDAKRAFLKSEQGEPSFDYGRRLDPSSIRNRLEGDLPAILKDNLRLALAGAVLQSDTSEEAVAEFRNANVRLYGEPELCYALLIMQRLRAKADGPTKPLFDYIESSIKLPTKKERDVFTPQDDTFTRYRTYFARYVGENALTETTLIGLLTQALAHTGLDKEGWHIKVLDDTSHARVVHDKKRINVGSWYVPRSFQSAEKIVFHEVYGHALRGKPRSVVESEGFATLLEQLVDDRFKLVRSFRFLAIALGWGLFGSPMTFREVYEIIWRGMVISGRYDEASAKSHAFDECARAFRGGRPDVPGAVFLKDSVYFTANLDIWQVLEQRPLDYNEFKDVIEGRRTLL